MADLSRIRWWQWLPIFGWRIVVAVDAADEVPHSLPRNGAALVGSQAYPKWLAFDCPCRTGHRIMISLDRNRRPHWTVSDAARLSVRPSVDYQTAKQRCHYFVRNGRIDWAKDTRRL